MISLADNDLVAEKVSFTYGGFDLYFKFGFFIQANNSERTLPNTEGATVQEEASVENEKHQFVQKI